MFEQYDEPPTCDEQDCGRLAEATCTFHAMTAPYPVVLPHFLCRDHAHVCSNKEVACSNCLAAAGAVE